MVHKLYCKIFFGAQFGVVFLDAFGSLLLRPFSTCLRPHHLPFHTCKPPGCKTQRFCFPLYYVITATFIHKTAPSPHIQLAASACILCVFCGQICVFQPRNIFRTKPVRTHIHHHSPVKFFDKVFTGAIVLSPDLIQNIAF